MKRRERKEVTFLQIKGVSEDGSFIYEVYASNLYTKIKLISYMNGTAEIAVETSVSISDLAKLASGIFSKHSNFFNVNSLVLNYRSIKLVVCKNNGRKDIISMLLKALSTSKSDNYSAISFIDMDVCSVKYDDNPSYFKNTSKITLFAPSSIWIKKLYSFDFEDILCWGKNMFFSSQFTKDCFTLSSLKNGIVTVECLAGGSISNFLKILKNFFIPYSNMYGIKGIEVDFNGFSIHIDDRNIDKIYSLFHQSCDFSSLLYEKDLNDYYNSPEYTSKHAKELKKRCRKNATLQKIKSYSGNKIDFSLQKNLEKDWEQCKSINSKDKYSNGVIEYTILWAQYMEYLINNYNKKISEIYDICSHAADIDGITGYMYGCAVNLLSVFWKYGDDLRIEHNKKYDYCGDGTVNPAILTISA